MRKYAPWAAVLAMALLLRLAQINAALWYDEAFSGLVAQLPAPMLLAATAADVHPPTYYLLLAVLTRTLGASEFVLRLPSLAAGLLLLPVVYRLAGCLHANTAARWLAVVLTAAAPYQIYYSTEARSYAMLTLVTALAALGLLERRYWLAVGGSLAALYLHNTAPLFIGPLWAISLRKERRYWLAAVAVAVGYLPGLWWAIRQAGQITGNYWVPPIESPGRLIATLDDLFWMANTTKFVFAAATITALVLVLLAIDLPHRIRSGAVLYVATFAPLLLLAVASVVWQPVLISRAMAPAAPFYYLLAAVAITASRRRLLAASVGLPVLLAVLLTAHRAPTDPALQAELASYDAIYHANVGSYVVWAYYLPEKEHFIWPQHGEGLKGTLSHQTVVAMGMDEIEFDLIKCATLGQTPARRWALIYSHTPVTSPREMEYVAYLTQNYPGHQTRLLRDDITTHAAVWEITPECDHAAILH